MVLPFQQRVLLIKWSNYNEVDIQKTLDDDTHDPPKAALAASHNFNNLPGSSLVADFTTYLYANSYPEMIWMPGSYMYFQDCPVCSLGDARQVFEEPRREHAFLGQSSVKCYQRLPSLLRADPDPVHLLCRQ